MGYIRHNAIAVTGMDLGSIGSRNFVTEAHAKASDLGLVVTPVVGSWVNGYKSFLVAPDGSKEGWEESDRGDTLRGELITFMDSMRYEDGSSPLSWAEVQYGDDNGISKVTQHSDEDKRQAPCQGV